MAKTEYVPFLKSKRYEILALSQLVLSYKKKLSPFFDFPKQDIKYDNKSFVETTDKIIKGLKKHINEMPSFYFDNYDIDTSLRINGEHNYAYLISKFAKMAFIPVVALDRSGDHISAVINSKKNRKINSEVVAFRITFEDFQDFSLAESDILKKLKSVFSLFSNIDLIFDCRICFKADHNQIAKKIVAFSNNFIRNFPTRKIVITGSSIPASIRDITTTESEIEIPRVEIDIFKSVKQHFKGGTPLAFGDFSIVSPNYSDLIVDKTMILNITAAKILYTFKGSHYVIRGSSVKNIGMDQYYDLAKILCSKRFYRGAEYSLGDQYFNEKSNRIGNNCTPSTIVKPSINAHISYMLGEDFLL